MSVLNTPRALTGEEQQWVDEWLPLLPMRISREAVYEVLGGLIKPQTLNVCDCQGNGPPVRYSIGRKVVYDTRVLLEWIVRKYGLKRHLDLAGLVASKGSRHPSAATTDADGRSAAP